MSFTKKGNKSLDKNPSEIESLHARLMEAEETLLAIRSGKVDALVVSTPQGDKVFTLKGAEWPYRVLMEKMKEGAVTLAGDDTIFYCNQGFADMLKRPLERTIGTGILQFISPADKPAFEEMLQQGRESSSKGEVTFLTGDGTAVQTHLSINAMRLDGLSSTVYLVATDITERKQAEEALKKAHDELEIKVQERTAELLEANEELHAEIAERERAEEELRESKQRYATTLASIGDAVIATDADGRITFMNTVAEELTGWMLAEALTRPVAEVFNIINEYTRAEVENPVTRVLREGTITGLANHTILVRKDGTEVPIDDSGAPIRDGDGRTMGVVLVFRDITERKHAEEALRKAHNELELRVQERTGELKEANKALMESEASYRDLTESIEDLFYAMDGELRCTYWNKASEAFTGVLAKDAIGKSLFELFPAVRGASVEQFYIEALKMQQPQRFENEYQLGDKKFIFEINAYPTKTGLSVIAKDITEKKMFEAHLLRAQRMESIGTLAGGIAHDLNNILTPMMMSLHMLKEKLKDEKSQKLLTILEQNSQRGADLIKQVLSFARGVEGERNPLAAKHIITEIERIAKETFPRNIQITTDIPKDLFTISGDATQLHQVMMNLCVNARDAMPDGGILNISAENSIIDDNYARMNAEAKVGSYAVIAVSDTGVGIPYNILDRIFEPFFTTKEFGKGTGLGLSTALAIVKSHGGFINVNSEIGKGTTFRVYLPAINAEMQNVEEQQLELPIGKGELVLVTEDEDSIREITCSTLEENGYKVITAIDGAEAVALFAKNIDEIKVILMDMMMPVMDGHASIKAIRKISPEVKIVTVSGLAEKEKLKNVADITNAFLSKPYTAEKLLKIIHEVLNEE